MKHLRYGAVAIWLILLFCSPAAGDENGITGILGAMHEEILEFEQALTDTAHITIEDIRFVSGSLGGRRVVVARTGVGKVNAAVTTALLIEHFKPTEIIVTGIAGAVNPGILPGDIVIADSIAYHDAGSYTPEGFIYWGFRNPATGDRNPVFFPADTCLVRIAEESARQVSFEKIYLENSERTPRVIRGIIVSGDSFISSDAKKHELRTALHADAVEMEGAAVAQVCYQRGVPCLVIRCISDLADTNASVDCERFRSVAAVNSARLVKRIIECK